MLKNYIAIMLGGAAGTGLRFWVAQWCAARYGESFPIGTMVVNVTGSFVISFFAGLTGPDGPWPLPPIYRHMMIAGVLGGYTTFSSFSFQTLTLMNEGQWSRAAANVLLSVALCLFAVWLGQLAARVFIQR